MRWSNPKLRALVWQALAAIAVVVAALLLAHETAHNLHARHIATGFGFLHQPASIPLGETPIRYTPSVSTYGRALLIGVLNTLKLAATGIVLATICGTAIGIARLSTSRLIAGMAASYVEVVRDIPVLLHLLFWYGVLLFLPPPGAAYHEGSTLFLCDRGLFIPCLVRGVWHYPHMGRFNIEGGASITPEYLALLIGLVIYTSSYIAEIVRAGLQAVPKGQHEAAAALGLKPAAALRLVLLPQAIRIIIPPLTSQYLNLTKNTSLALVIGYQDIVAIADTTLNQTGQAIEGVAIIMGVFLGFSLLTSLAMHLFERHMALPSR